MITKHDCSSMRTLIWQKMKLLKSEIDCSWSSSAKKELKAEDVETYKREHPLLPADIYKAMSKSTHLYPDFMKLFKLYLLIPPSTANVRRGFSVLAMLHTKYRSSLSPNSLDKLMRLVLLGAPTLSDKTWEGLLDRYDQKHEHRIRLKQ